MSSPRLNRTTLLIVTVAAVWLAEASAARGQSLWELTPYRIQVYLDFRDDPQLTPLQKQGLQQHLVNRVDALIGSSWTLQVASAPQTLSLAAAGGLRNLTVEHLPAESLTLDKILLLQTAWSYSGYELEARELDVRTRTWGTIVARSVAQPALLPDAAVDVLLLAFAPLAKIETVKDKQVLLRLRAAGLPSRDPQALALAPGAVFVPIIRYNDREGNLRSDRPPQPIAWTYLLAGTVQGSLADCQLYTGLRSPLSTRRRGRTEQLALAVRPPQAATQLVVHSRLDKNRRLFGYEVYAYTPDSPTTTLLGRTGSDGSLLIEPAAHPLRLLIVKNGSELLARLPLVPGVEPVALAAVPDDDKRLEAEGYITGLQEEVVDLVARRAMLKARIEARLEEGKAREANELLFELRQLATRDDLDIALREQRNQYLSIGDAVIRRKIDKLFDDTRQVFLRNLDPKLVEELTVQVNEAMKSAPAATTPGTPPPATPASG